MMFSGTARGVRSTSSPSFSAKKKRWPFGRRFFLSPEEKLEPERRRRGQGLTRNEYLQQITDAYKDSPDPVDPQKEAVAKFLSEYAFQDANALMDLARTDRNWFQSVYEQIRRFIARLQGDMPNKIDLIKIDRMFAKAAKASNSPTQTQKSPTTESGAEYAINVTEDGIKYVNLDGNIFKKSDGSVLTPREAYNALVGQKITLEDGDVITFIKNLPGRSIYNELFKKLPGYEPGIDVKAISETINKNIVEVVEASQIQERNQKQKHPHVGVIDFDQREVYLYDGQEVFRMELCIANLTDGKKIAYVKRYIEHATEDVSKKIKKAETARQTHLKQLSTTSIHHSSKKSNTNFSQTDADYMDAINSGDMDTAQRMVDEAAKKAGYTEEVFHGMTGRYNEYKSGNGQYGEGVYFTADKTIARGYGDVVDHLYVKVGNIANYGDAYKALGKKDDQTMDEFANSLGFPSFDEMVEDWDNDPTDIASNNELIDLLKNKDFEGFVDDGNAGFVLWDFDGIAYRIKSADPVTYDDNGNVIPLSHRFDSSKSDIRYSLPTQPQAENVPNTNTDQAATETTDAQAPRNIVSEPMSEQGYADESARAATLGVDFTAMPPKDPKMSSSLYIEKTLADPTVPEVTKQYIRENENLYPVLTNAEMNARATEVLNSEEAFAAIVDKVGRGEAVLPHEMRALQMAERGLTPGAEAGRMIFISAQAARKTGQTLGSIRHGHTVEQYQAMAPEERRAALTSDYVHQAVVEASTYVNDFIDGKYHRSAGAQIDRAIMTFDAAVSADKDAMNRGYKGLAQTAIKAVQGVEDKYAAKERHSGTRVKKLMLHALQNDKVQQRLYDAIENGMSPMDALRTVINQELGICSMLTSDTTYVQNVAKRIGLTLNEMYNAQDMDTAYELLASIDEDVA